MKDAEVDLLVDLAKLLKKYGPEPFEGLARSISSTEVSARLAAILTHAAVIVRSSGHVKASADHAATVRAAPIASLLEALRGTEPEKFSLLRGLYEDLKEARILPTMRDVRTFLSDRGLPGVGATSRDKAIVALMRVLMTLPAQECRSCPPGYRDTRNTIGIWRAVAG